IDHPRRSFLGTLALGAALAPFGAIGGARAQTSPSPAAPAAATGQRAQASFAPLKRITAGVLEVGYAEAGPADGPPVLLLHGWPYDIHSYVEVAPILAGAGCRVIVPYLRGYGTTRFLSEGTPRNGQQAALARDLIALMDALKIKQAV
ncbi:alpha/beta fold hydrolase, partial [Lysobacter sp. TAB13]